MRALRERRLNYVRAWLHTRNLDIGAGWFPVTPDSVTLDVERVKSPAMVADASALPFADGAFDSATCLEVLEHFDPLSQLRILAGVWRVLSPGGQLVVSVPYSKGPWLLAQKVAWWVRSRTTQAEYYQHERVHGHVGLCGPRELCSMLAWCGFRVVAVRRLMLYDLVVVAKKGGRAPL